MADRITFDRTLYLPEAVEAAAAVYADYAAIELAATPEGVVAVVSKTVGHDVGDVVSAFCNHVLYETITRRHQLALDEGA